METIKKIDRKMVTGYAFTYLMLVVAGVVNALGLYIFIIPNYFSPGGVTGIAVMIQYLTGFNSGYLVLAMNIPLLILAFIFLSKEFAVKTAISIGLSSLLLIILPLIPGIEKLQYTPDESILVAIAGGCISGFVLGILLKLGGCNGGSEIIARFVQRKLPAYNIAWVIFAFDTVVVLITAFTISQRETMDIILLSIMKMFVSSLVCSTFLEGFSSALKFEVVTLHPEELSREIILKLGRGVTQIKARGGYTGQEKTILICIIRKREISTFQRILKSYPDTFAYIMNTKEVYGRGFSIPNVKPEALAVDSKPSEPANDEGKDITGT